MLDLDCVPDRVEPDGLPVMKPGGLRGPYGHSMPRHLPAVAIECVLEGRPWPGYF